MKRDTIANKRANLEAKHREELARLENEERILSLLPQHLPAPTISNIKGNTAWVSFPDERAYSHSPPLGEYTGSDMLNEIEKCCMWLGAALYKPKGYRASAHAKGYYPYEYEIESEEDIAPMFVMPSQYAGGAAVAFYQVGAWRLHVSVPERRAMLTAERMQFRGDWRYERGTGKIIFPQNWHSLANATALLRSAHCYVDTEKGLSGAVYWTLTGDAQLSPAEMLRELEGT